MGAMGAIEAFFLFQMKKLHCAEKPKPMAVFTMESPVRFGSNNRTSGSVRFRPAMLWYISLLGGLMRTPLAPGG